MLLGERENGIQGWDGKHSFPVSPAFLSQRKRTAALSVCAHSHHHSSIPVVLVRRIWECEMCGRKMMIVSVCMTVCMCLRAVLLCKVCNNSRRRNERRERRR